MKPEPPEFPVVPLDGVTELRIHGVSGTPVESMLQHPHPMQVWGDKIAGFYRRPEPDTGSRREAYSWGGLTAGASARAAWLLLLPFMLVNVAAWAHPTRPRTPDGKYTPVGIMSGAVRVVGLCLTLLLVLGAAVVGMDLLAWQCAGDELRCGGERWFTRWLTDGWVSTPSRRIAVGAVFPLLLVAAMRWLSTSTAKNYEEYDAATGVTADDPELPQGANDLANTNFWRGGGPLERLRRLHVGAALATVAGLVAYAAGIRSRGDVTIPRVVLALSFVVVVLAVLALVSPLTGRRRVLLSGDTANVHFCRAVAAAPYVGIGLVALALTDALFWTSRPDASGPLPGLHGTKHVLFVAMAAALALMLVGNVLAIWDYRRTFRESVRKPMLLGFLAPFLALLGLVIGGAYAAGVGIRFADYLGRPVDPRCLPGCRTGEAMVLAVPREYYWLARGFGVAFVLALVVVGVVLATKRKAVAKALPGVVDEYPDYATGKTHESRRRTIAAIHAGAARTDSGATLAALVVIGAGVVTIVTTAAFDEGRVANALTTFGTWLVGAFALGIVALGRSAYRNGTLRKTVGIAWDLGTFWPRSAHPFAPPCYCERVVPEFGTRIQKQLRAAGGRVVVSAHSQGTVIAAAALLQLRQTPDGICLVTYGSPLHRLYARAFPHFFGLSVLGALDTLYGGRWVNLYRRSDPIGGPVLVGDADVPGDDEPPVRPDRRLHDPAFARPEHGFTDPPSRGHSDYFHDPAFGETVEALADEVG